MIDEIKPEIITQESESSDDEQTKSFILNDSNESRFEFHPLLKDNLKKDDFNDRFITKLCEMER